MYMGEPSDEKKISVSVSFGLALAISAAAVLALGVAPKLITWLTDGAARPLAKARWRSFPDIGNQLINTKYVVTGHVGQVGSGVLTKKKQPAMCLCTGQLPHGMSVVPTPGVDRVL